MLAMKPIFGIDSFITKWKHIKYTLALYTLAALFFSLSLYMIYMSLIASVVPTHMYNFFIFFCQRLRGFPKFLHKFQTSIFSIVNSDRIWKNSVCSFDDIKNLNIWVQSHNKWSIFVLMMILILNENIKSFH